MKIQVDVHCYLYVDGCIDIAKRSFERFEVEVDLMKDLKEELSERYGGGWSAGSDGSDGQFDKSLGSWEACEYPFPKYMTTLADKCPDTATYGLCTYAKELKAKKRGAK